MAERGPYLWALQRDGEEKMSKITGGPAFPSRATLVAQQGTPLGEVEGIGMTLRDYFAAAVLAGNSLGAAGMGHEHIAALAYCLADAMLEERNK